MNVKWSYDFLLVIRIIWLWMGVFVFCHNWTRLQICPRKTFSETIRHRWYQAGSKYWWNPEFGGLIEGKKSATLNWWYFNIDFFWYFHFCKFPSTWGSSQNLLQAVERPYRKTEHPTPLKTNMEPGNTPLEKEKHLQTINFWVPCLFSGV